MSEMSLAEQIKSLDNMKSYLKSFCVEMQEAMDSLDKQIRELKGQGFSIETEETYRKGYYTPVQSDVDQVVEDIHRMHIPYIEDVMEALKRAGGEK